MSAQEFYHVIILAVFLMTKFCDVTLAQINCAQIDFNRTTYPEFRECKGKFYPIFVIKDYASHSNEVKPYRNTSRYYLSNNFNEFSCVESAMFFVIDNYTKIEAAIYLKSIESSFVEIVVYDADRNERIDSLRTDGTNGWQILQKNIRFNIHNARVSVPFPRIDFKNSENLILF